MRDYYVFAVVLIEYLIVTENGNLLVLLAKCMKLSTFLCHKRPQILIVLLLIYY